MRTLKKIAACVAAAMTMICVAVTASADYEITGRPHEDSDRYGLTVSGLPEEAFKHSEFQLQIALDNNNPSEFLVLTGYLDGASCEATISVVNKDDPDRLDIIRELPVQRAFTGLDFDFDPKNSEFNIAFEKDDEYLAKMMTLTNAYCVLTVNTDNGDTLCLDGNGRVVQFKIENVALKLRPLSSTSEPTSSAPTSEPTSSAPASEPTSSAPASEPTSSAPASEPTSSAPASEPTSSAPTSEPTSSAPTSEPTSSAQTSTPASEPASSTPASEPAASAPESTAASSENTSKPNPIIVIGGIAFAAAAIAAGAVIVARRKK